MNAAHAAQLARLHASPQFRDMVCASAWRPSWERHASLYTTARLCDPADANASLDEAGRDIGADLRPGFTLAGVECDYVDAGAAVDDDALWVAALSRQMDREEA